PESWIRLHASVERRDLVPQLLHTSTFAGQEVEERLIGRDRHLGLDPLQAVCPVQGAAWLDSTDAVNHGPAVARKVLAAAAGTLPVRTGDRVAPDCRETWWTCSTRRPALESCGQCGASERCP